MTFPAFSPVFPRRWAGLLIPPLLLAACAGPPRWPVFEPSPRPKAPASRPAPRPQAQAPRSEPLPQPPVPAAPEEASVGGGAPVAASPPVLALLDEAQANVQSGDYDGAAASLERAIRIQPKNPQLWHDLAVVRLKQQQPGLAEDLAKKSNLHAKGDKDLARANWTLIAEARRLKGDAQGAADALEKAGQ